MQITNLIIYINFINNYTVYHIVNFIFLFTILLPKTNKLY